VGGGGGGIGGNGGDHAFCRGGAGGGGGARGNGAKCGSDGVEGGGGGGTIASAVGTRGAFNCGGDGGHAGGGHNAPCPGGGGGGAGDTLFLLPGEDGADGGDGHYGGGGGGGTAKGDGGRGGFGGGGGASGFADFLGVDGGNGGFGGGGGAGNNGGVTDGDPGNGGFFAGSGSSSGGGGGAGLGGAIFNAGGTVDIRNSTFTANGVNGGFSDQTQDGSGGGGAIFSVNGHLTVLNSTISGNTANFGGGIIVAQVSENGGIFGGLFGDDSELAPTSLVLENTIISGNGQYECAITGTSIGVAFVGNLIQHTVADGTRYHREEFVGCGGVVATSDPQLGPLSYNQGATPTMAISTASAARNVADAVTSLAIDQRRQPRPANGGYDIGAFELCLDGPPIAQMPCVILAGIDPGHAVNLTIDSEPAAGGTTAPAPGTRQVELNSVVALTAIPSAGYRFTDWSANVVTPGAISTTVVMSASQTVTAHFAACTCAVDPGKSIAVTLRDVPDHETGPDVWLATLTNNSAAAIVGPISLVFDNLSAGVTLSNATGSTALMLPGGSPYIDAALLRLAPGQSIMFPVLFTNPDNVAFTYDTRVLVGAGSR
jgi:List-Bact-rpt repeat protein